MSIIMGMQIFITNYQKVQEIGPVSLFFQNLNLGKTSTHPKYHLTITLATSCQYQCVCKISSQYSTPGRGSSIGSEFAWDASGPEFDPHVRHILSWRLGHENISTAILPLPLIQEEHLSVTGERMCTALSTD